MFHGDFLEGSAFHPLVNVVEVIEMLGFLQVAVGQLLVAGVPCALPQRQLAVVGGRRHFLAGDGELVTPAARAAPCE